MFQYFLNIVHVFNKKEQENEIKVKKNNNEKDLIIYNLQEKSEEYRKIVEKTAMLNFVIFLKIRFCKSICRPCCKKNLLY